MAASIPLIGPLLRAFLRLVSVLIWGITVLAAFGGKFNPDYFAIPAVLCLALPYLAILSAILIILWIITKRLGFAAIGVLAMFACIEPLTQAFPLNGPKTPARGTQTFTLISWNSLHLEDLKESSANNNRAVGFLINSGADVICLEELDNLSSEFDKVPESLRDSLFKTYPYRCGQSTTDIKVLSKFPVTQVDLSALGPYQQRGFDFFKISFPKQTLTVAVTHLTSYELSEDERNVVDDIKSVKTAKSSVRKFKRSIFAKLKSAFKSRAANARLLHTAIEQTPGALIVCGDFNDVPGSWAYNTILANDMRDAYAETNFGPAHTYNRHLFLFHIDHILYRGPLKALNVEVDKINTSDHYPLVAEFEFTGS